MNRKHTQGRCRINLDTTTPLSPKTKTPSPYLPIFAFNCAKSSSTA